jgi:hypothetical protein
LTISVQRAGVQTAIYHHFDGAEKVRNGCGIALLVFFTNRGAGMTINENHYISFPETYVGQADCASVLPTRFWKWIRLGINGECFPRREDCLHIGRLASQHGGGGLIADTGTDGRRISLIFGSGVETGGHGVEKLIVRPEIAGSLTVAHYVTFHL